MRKQPTAAARAVATATLATGIPAPFGSPRMRGLTATM